MLCIVVLKLSTLHRTSVYQWVFPEIKFYHPPTTRISILFMFPPKVRVFSILLHKPGISTIFTSPLTFSIDTINKERFRIFSGKAHSLRRLFIQQLFKVGYTVQVNFYQ